MARTGKKNTNQVNFMKNTQKIIGKIFSVSLTVALIFLLLAVIIHVVSGAAAVDLGSAGNFAILAKSGITTTGTTSITGNIGVSPIAATAMTGFGLIMDPTNQFSRSSLVVGKVYAANYASPTPATLTTAVGNMQTAYTSAAGQSIPDATELYAGNLGGRTLAPGLYKWSTGILIPSSTTLTLDAKGNAGAVWIFQVAGDFTMNAGSQILLKNGAKAENIYWQVGGPTSVTIGPGAHVEGTILAQKAITMKSGASLHGRALAQTAVTLIANTIIQPVSSGTASQTVTVNVGGNSGVYQTVVTGKGLNGLIVTGMVASGPGKNIIPASGKVYQYLDLVPAQYTSISQVLLSFRVPLTWLNRNHSVPQNVRLYRLDGKTWTALPVTFVKTVGTQDYFTAPGTGFSRFAISG